MSSPNQAFRAMADETRREILRLLRDGPLTSGDIANRFDSSWPTVSRHLAVLRDAGLVATERHGQEIRYELDTSVFQDLVQHLVEWTRPTGGAPGPCGSRSGTVSRRPDMSLRWPHLALTLAGCALGLIALAAGLPGQMPPSCVLPGQRTVWLGAPMAAFLLPTAALVTDVVLRRLAIRRALDDSPASGVLPDLRRHRCGG